MKTNREKLQDKKDTIKEFFTNNKQFVQIRVCNELGISPRAIYVICKTKHQALNTTAINKLIDFIAKEQEKH